MEGSNGVEGRVLPFEFSGRAGEFFAIWMVNVALTIVTLGIYSAWAKVRTNQYFYGNTTLDGASFRYLASPVQILKGRAVAFALFVAYYASSQVSPLVSGLVLLALIVLFPAFLVMSMSFRLRNSAWRNVRFDFRRDFGKAYSIFAVPMLIVVAYVAAMVLVLPQRPPGTSGGEAPARVAVWLSAGLPVLIMLCIPWMEFLLVRFIATHAGYGREPFRFSARLGSYYGMYATGFLILLLAVTVIAGVVGVVGGAFTAAGEQGPGSTRLAAIMPVVVALLFLPLYLWFFAYIKTRRTNLVLNHLELGGHRLHSGLKVGYMTWLYFSNTMAILLSLGLMIPWARIRTARYRASCTALHTHGDLGDFATSQRGQSSAVGEEVGEMFDVGLGF